MSFEKHSSVKILFKKSLNQRLKYDYTHIGRLLGQVHVTVN